MLINATSGSCRAVVYLLSKSTMFTSVSSHETVETSLPYFVAGRFLPSFFFGGGQSCPNRTQNGFEYRYLLHFLRKWICILIRLNDALFTLRVPPRSFEKTWSANLVPASIASFQSAHIFPREKLKMLKFSFGKGPYLEHPKTGGSSLRSPLAHNVRSEGV